MTKENLPKTIDEYGDPVKPATPLPTTPMQMVALAIEKGTDADSLSRLLDVQERWDANNAKKAFDNAMAEFQKNPPTIIKSAEGHNCNYAPLDQITKMVSPALAAHGLNFTWETATGENGAVIVTCLINHMNGHTKQTRLAAPPDATGSKNAVQSIGSTVTYLQRYTLMAALGLSATMDDDGQASGSDVDLISQSEAIDIADAADDKGIPLERILKAYGVNQLVDLPKQYYSKVMQQIENTEGKK